MPVGTTGDCRLSGGPRSPRAREFLQKIWSDRGASKYGGPDHKGGVPRPFVERRYSSTLSLNDEEIGSVAVGGCPAINVPSPFEFRRPRAPPLSRASSLHLPGESAKHDRCGNQRFIDRNPLLSLHQSIECSSGDSPDDLLPLDLIQSSVSIADSPDTGITSTPGHSGYTGQHGPEDTTFSQQQGPPQQLREFSRNSLQRSFCSCKRSSKPTWKSYEEAIQKSSGGGSGGISLISGGESANRGGESNRVSAKCWCWSSKLVLYTIYLCVVFAIAFFTEATKMAMVPITVFLIVLSLALFLFILFCVCFIIFI